MRMVLLGPPGAGKGSLAGALKRKYHLAHVSTGDMLREEIKKATPLGSEIKNLIDHGSLASDEVVNKLVEQFVMTEANLEKGYMLDGYPRTVRQAEDLDKILHKFNAPLDVALNLQTDRDVILKRLAGRRVCHECGALFHIVNKKPLKSDVCDVCSGALYQRADDNEETILARLKVYDESTCPIVAYYKAQGKLKLLDGNLETDDLCKSLAYLFK